MDSSIPGAFFTLTVTSGAEEEADFTLALSLNNPSKSEALHRVVKTASFQGVELGDTFSDTEHPDYGQLIFGVPVGDEMQVQHYWYRGNWFDNIAIFWRDFIAPGALRDRVYEQGNGAKQGEDLATIAVRKTLKPRETWRQRFFIGWYYPNYTNYWSNRPSNHDDSAIPDGENRTWKNYYTTLFSSPSAIAEYSLREWDRLESETRLFHGALYSSALPEDVKDAVGANLAVLKSPTVLRLTNGGFYGWEGCSCHDGSCEGSCTHVWNYTQALPFLFPKLERSMRELDYTYNQREDGGMPFRLQLPLGREKSKFRPCVDGQMGGIIKTYREWRLSGDDEWLRTWWDRVKKSLEFAWAETNEDRWDPEKSGIITGRQHHTLDMELFGPNAWLNGFYVGALKAANEMAEAMGDPDAQLYASLYENGRAYTDAQLFNGEYYIQKIDVRDKSILAPYSEGSTLTGGSTVSTYWSDEAQQIKYQIAGGCIIDQVLGQWMCEIAGVGEILDKENVDSALRAIYKHNFKESVRFHFNPCRIYSVNDESGLAICEWPEGAEKPVVPIPYAEETMHGFEYQAATHMIRRGMETEGLRVVKGIRDRYDGTLRNPWNEMECGSNYARSMASYALLLTYGGFSFDMRRGYIGFRPMNEGSFFWSADGAWGTFTLEGGKSTFEVLWGEIALCSLGLPDGTEADLRENDEPIVLKAGAKRCFC